RRDHRFHLSRGRGREERHRPTGVEGHADPAGAIRRIDTDGPDAGSAKDGAASAMFLLELGSLVVADAVAAEVDDQLHRAGGQRELEAGRQRFGHVPQPGDEWRQAQTGPAEQRRHDPSTLRPVQSRTRLGHHTFRPMSYDKAGTSSDRTMNVSIRTPKATRKAIWPRNRIGITPRAENVAASTRPADVMTPPVTVNPRRMPGRVPDRNDSSRTRVMRKML